MHEHDGDATERAPSYTRAYTGVSFDGRGLTFPARRVRGARRTHIALRSLWRRLIFFAERQIRGALWYDPQLMECRCADEFSWYAVERKTDVALCLRVSA